MSNFDYDLLQEMSEEAPQAGFGPNINFGKLTVDAQIVKWTGDKDNRTAETRPLTKGDKADKSKGEYVQLTFAVDIAEFNPTLEWQYERTVDMKVSGPRATTNWSEIVLPSLLAVFGDDWAKKILKSPYVAIEDADDVNGKTSRKTGKVLNVPKFIAVYRNKSECEKAREAKYAKQNGTVSSDTSYPVETINQVKALVGSMPGGVEAVRKLIDDNKPYGEYTGKELLEAAGFEVK